MNRGDLPLSFVMALAQNESAVQRFEGLSEAQKETVLNKTRKINSKHEMQAFVSALNDGTLTI